MSKLTKAVTVQYVKHVGESTGRVVCIVHSNDETLLKTVKGIAEMGISFLKDRAPDDALIVYDRYPDTLDGREVVIDEYIFHKPQKD